MRKTVSFLCLCSALLCGPARALTLVTEKTVKDQPGAVGTTTMYLDPDHMRIDSAQRSGAPSIESGGARRPQGVGEVMLFDNKVRRLLILRPEQKTYAELTDADLQRLRSQAEAQGDGQRDKIRVALEAKMKTMTPEQRKMMEQMMARQGTTLAGGPAPAPPRPERKFAPMGQKKTVHGMACEMYRVTEGDRLVEQDCLSVWGAGLVTREDLSVLTRFLESFTSMLHMSPNQMAGELKSYPGFPIVRTVLGPDGKPESEETVKTIKRERLPAELFTVPPGFTRDANSLGIPHGPAPQVTP